MPQAAGKFEYLPAPYRRQAFVPHALPPQVEYTPELTSLLSKADYALGGVASIADFVPNPDLFIEPFLTVEAVLSSRIEGTQSTTEDVFRAELSDRTSPDPDTQVTMNYLAAMRMGFEAIQTGRRPLGLDLVCELHGKLLNNVRGHDRSPGCLREITVWLGSKSIEYATYVAPPWSEVPSLMRQWEEYIHECVADRRRQPGPRLVQCAEVHAQFEMIHPFRDGNGRIGRLLMNLFLLATGLITKPVLLLSAFFEQHREEYYTRLRAISETGDWAGWISFFLRGVEVQCLRANRAAKAVIDLRDEWRSRIQQENAPGYLLTLLDRLFENPYTTVKNAEQQLEVSIPTATKAIQKLVEFGFLEEITGRKRGKEFRATGLLAAIEALVEQ